MSTLPIAPATPRVPGQSGPGADAVMMRTIIDRPNLQTVSQRVLYGSVTLVFWALWIYLWLPILTLIGWMLGIRIAYKEMVVRNGSFVLKAMLVTYVIVRADP